MSNSLAIKVGIGPLLKFTLPTIVMMVFTSLYTIVDGFFVSRFVNTDALSAVNLVYPMLSIVVAMGTMFGSGVTAIVSKKIGEGKVREAQSDFSFVMLCAFLFSILFSILVYWKLEPLLYFMGANDAVYGYCYDYALPLVFFLPASLLQLAYQYALVADGKPRLGLMISLLGGVSNIIFDYLFIAVFDMGISGAAIATGIGYVIPAVLGSFYFFFNRRGSVRFVLPRVHWRILLHSVTNGSSEMVSNLAASVTTLLFNLMMMRYLGQDGVAAITIVLYMDFLLIAVNLGYSMGVTPLIGFNYGCKNNEKLQRLFRISLWAAGVFAVLVTVATVIFAEPLVQIFAHKESAVFSLAVTGLRIYALSYLFKGFNIFGSAMFTAFSDGKISAILSFVRTLGFIVLCVLLLATLFGVTGLWLAVPVAELLTLGLSIFCFRRYGGKYGYLKQHKTN